MRFSIPESGSHTSGRTVGDGEDQHLAWHIPVNLTPPTTSGGVLVGSQRNADPGTWAGRPPPSVVVQWQRNDLGVWMDLVGLIGLSIPLPLLGTYRAQVTGTNIAGSTTVYTDSFVAVLF